MPIANHRYALAIHGGCGDVDKFSPRMQDRFLQSLASIIAVGNEELARGAAALDVVERCVRMLEDDPLYNAGKGSVLTADGRVEMDASIMDGRTLKAGAVAGLTHVQNPISVARQVMEATEHVLLAGAGADAFAHAMRAPRRPERYFITARRRQQLAEAKRRGYVGVDHRRDRPNKTGTVGAVARDIRGHLAAATSTGGLTNKRYGRVSDSALIGCGTYAHNSTGAVSCTGIGEHFIRSALAKYASDVIALRRVAAPEAARRAVAYLRAMVDGGYGGLIVVDRRGRVGHAYTTAGMIRAWVTQGAEPRCALFAA